MLKFVVWIARKISEAADQEYYSPDAIKRELLDLSTKVESGEISEEEYNKKETELLDRLSKSDNSEESE